jgi:hypothetical protein
MDGGKNKAFAYQLKCRNIKYSFIIVENKSQEPISVLAYKGAIVARPGFVFLDDGLFYFIGYDKGARAKCVDEKMDPAEVALASMTSLALSQKVSYLDIIDNLWVNGGDIGSFSIVLAKGIRKYYNDKK